MHLFINSLAATAGGGLTYLRGVIPATDSGLKLTVALSPRLGREFHGFSNIDLVEFEIPPARRFWYEQSTLPSIIRRCGADVLLSAGNFALRRSPVPQILLSRNSIYTSASYYRDLRARREYRFWLDTHLRGWLAQKSVRWADLTVSPSEAFASDLRCWTGMPVRVIHHGFDPEAFTRDSSPLAPQLEEKMRSAEESFKLLFVSHYNYYRNFETLLRALPLLRNRLAGRSVKLLVTCRFLAQENPGPYRPQSAARLVKELKISDLVAELGSVPYHQLHQIYRRANAYVTPAYTETFAHPLVEAMASGLPVVASDLAVHREICGDAAVYFPPFSPEALSERLAQLVESPQMSRRMAAIGLEQSRQFSWKTHVEGILQLAEMLIDAKSLKGTVSAQARGL